MLINHIPLLLKCRIYPIMQINMEIIQWLPFWYDGKLAQFINSKLVCLLLYYILATSKVISGWIPTYDRAHSW